MKGIMAGKGSRLVGAVGCLLIAGALLVPAMAAAQDPVYGWTKVAGGTGDDQARKVAVDSSGNVYTAGYFSGTVDFATDFGSSDVKNSAGSRDIFVTRINADGTYAWTRRMGGTGDDMGLMVAVDPGGNVYTSGYFSGSVDFAADFGGSDLKNSAGGQDVFITRINADGTYGWTRRIGGTYDDEGHGVAFDSSGNVYLAGTFGSSFGGTLDFAADFGSSDVKTSAGQGDIFITRMTADGSYGWTKTIGGTGDDGSYAVSVDPGGAVYLTGWFRATVNFAAGWSGTEMKTSAGDSDIFVTRIEADGSYGWTKRMGGLYGDSGRDISADSSGNVYVVGTFGYQSGGTVNFAADWSGNDLKTSAGPQNMFVTRVNADGGYGWTRRMGGPSWDGADSVAIGPDGKVYVSGYFRSSVNFAADFGGSDVKSPPGDIKLFVSLIYPDGSYGWTRAAGGSNAEATSVALDSLGNVYAVGSYQGTVNFAADFGGSDTKASDAGSADIFNQKILPPADTDNDGVADAGDNCPEVPNTDQSDFDWNSKPGTLVLFDNSFSTHTWAVSPELTGTTVHDGDTAARITGNDYIQEIALGQSGPQRYLRFWIYLTSHTADLALQMNCVDGNGWNHRWGFSGDGIWSGVSWGLNGSDMNLPVGQWVPVTLDIQNELSCASGSEIDGIGWGVNSGDVAFLDSAAFYNTVPLGDSCDDTDGDGLSDGDEVLIYGTDPLLADTDADGLSDGIEVLIYGTDPLLQDTDGDNLTDGDEILMYGTSPTAADTDGDGINDYDEIFIYNTNPTSTDTDGDGLDDGFEIQTSLTNPLSPDSDGDGLSDGDEVLIYGSDPLSVDSDGDGISDFDEVMDYHSDPWLADSDGDGLSDWSEIYVTHTDPTLADTNGNGVPDGMEAGDTLTDRDGDGMPNGWERQFGCLQADTADASADPDGDGLTNLQEYQAGTNPCAADSDGDGLDDYYELNTSLTSPLLADTDGDGLNDGDEINTYSTDPLNADSDGDGFSDGSEVAAGSDPNDPNSIPAQPSRLINYQGRLADSGGQPVNGTADLAFAIYNAPTGGTALWSETQASANVQQGIYYVLLGSVTPLTPGIFNNPDLYLEVSVNGETMSSRQRITSVPFAMKAEELLGGRIETDTRALVIGAPAAGITLHVSFNHVFTAPPRVWVSALDSTIGGKKFIDTVIANVTTSGFDVTFDSLDGQAAAGSASFIYAAYGN